MLIIAGMVIGGLQNFSGGRSLFTSSVRVFQNADIDPYVSVGLSIALFTSGLVSNFMAIFMMDKLGRKPMLLWR